VATPMQAGSIATCQALDMHLSSCFIYKLQWHSSSSGHQALIMHSSIWLDKCLMNLSSVEARSLSVFELSNMFDIASIHAAAMTSWLE